MILLIDNYDSFTYNLYQYLGEMGQELEVVRNDVWTIAQIKQAKPTAIVISPGPGTPKDAGVCLEVVQHFSGSVPILGICLGLQTIGEAFGGRVVHSPQVMHGKTSPLEHSGTGLYTGVPAQAEIGRYHSLIVERETLPDVLEITATTKNDGEQGIIMGLRHKEHPTEGIQFHPESVLTPHGKTMLLNFVNLLGVNEH